MALAVLVGLAQPRHQPRPAALAGFAVVGFILGFATRTACRTGVFMMILINRPYDVGDAGGDRKVSSARSRH